MRSLLDIVLNANISEQEKLYWHVLTDLNNNKFNVPEALQKHIEVLTNNKYKDYFYAARPFIPISLKIQDDANYLKTARIEIISEKDIAISLWRQDYDNMASAKSEKIGHTFKHNTWSSARKRLEDLIIKEYL